jgi:branched-chain amino acid transport system permease protein
VTGVWGLVIMLAAGVGAALVVSAVIATFTLRVSGFYFAMVSLFLALVVPAVTQNWSLTGGGNGISLVSVITFTQKPSGVALYEVGIGLIVAMAGYMWMIRNSRLGRRFGAIAASEDLAQSIGVSPYPTKLIAFLLAAVPVGLAGGFFTFSQQIMSPDSISIESSIYILAGVVVGGGGTILGPIIGVALVGAGTQFLGSFNQYQGLIYGAALVLVAMGLPTGIMGLYRDIVIWVAQRLGKPLTMAPPAAVAEGEATVPVHDEVQVPLHRRVFYHFRTPEVPTAGEIKVAEAGAPAIGAPVVATNGASPDAPLVVRGAARSFGGVRAVDGVDITIERGKVHALVGPNGSGKTTLLNLICGYYRLDAGEIGVGDVRLDTLHAVSKVARRGVARTFQTPKLNPYDTALGNVLVGADRTATGSLWGSVLHSFHSRRTDKRNTVRSMAALGDVGMTDQWFYIASLVPHGTQRLLEIARAMATDPTFVLLDEPAAGLSAAEAEVLKQSVRDMAASGLGVLIVEHNLPIVFDIADTVTVLHQGRVIAEGTPAEVSADPEVIRVYIGRSPTETEESSIPTGGAL